MPANRKYFINNTALFVTTRTEDGLPMVPAHHMNYIIWGILARAKTLYQIKVCHFVFMANHFHMLLVVEDPEHVSNFTGYLKAEIAHAINHLRGRRKKTVWSEGYDSPIVLTSKDVMKYIKYIYLNPLKANLVDSVKDYPGVSSWRMYRGDNLSATHKHLSRASVPRLSTPALSINEQQRLVERFSRTDTGGQMEEFILEPDAWMSCFSEYRGRSSKEVKAEILDMLSEGEAEYRALRESKEQEVIGATALRRQSMDKEYLPEAYGKKMICLCSDVELRIAFIAHYRELCRRASEVYEKWKLGDLSCRLPAGMLAPRLPVLESALSVL